MASGSKTAVMTAIGANSLVTVAKLVGFALTGSGAMLAEGVHSLADVGNQALLAVGMNRAERPPDDVHPDGYAMEAFVWSIISAVGIFFLGCGVSLAHGIESLLHPSDHGPEGGGIAIGILIFALVVEGASLAIAVRIAAKHARDRDLGFWEHVKTSDDPFELAVLLEDSAAVLGVIIALVAVVLTEVTGVHTWDSIGTIIIGLLLGVVAISLIERNRVFLVGRAATPEHLEAVEAVLEADPAVEYVTDIAAIVVGADQVRLRAELELDGRVMADTMLKDTDLEALLSGFQEAEHPPEALRDYLREFADDVVELAGDEVDRLEDMLRKADPSLKRIELEAD